ncbi:MAG: alpha-2-macroglobulin [Planctomycetaceae bacterium]|nr:alpha-2-macroglobulin [Planctomycetaceae bacterium]
MMLYVFFIVLLFAMATVQADAAENPVEKGQQLLRDNLPKDALELLRPWVLNEKTQNSDPALTLIIQCLQRLNRMAEIDTFLEDAVKIHKDDWKVLWTVGDLYIQFSYTGGSLIGNKYQRGVYTGKRVFSTDRDRVRALQLFKDAVPLALKDEDKNGVADFFLAWTRILQGEHWKMQALTDIAQLPDYSDEWQGRHGWNGNTKAPVDIDGNPVVYALPESFETAKNNGERWRWCLEQAANLGKKNEALTQRADFYQSQFGVQTLTQFEFFRSTIQDPQKTASILTMETLTDDETLAQLATGIKRFKLPKEADYIALYKEAEQWMQLANIFQNRRQYDKAVEYYNKALDKETNEDVKQFIQAAIHQILGNWGHLEPNGSRVAGLDAKLRYVFRNGKKVNITVNEINTEKLLADVQEYLKSKPPQLNWQRIQIETIGQQLIYGEDKDKLREQYIGKEIAKWSIELQPAEKHFDTATVIPFSQKKGGAYLVRTEMDNGNAENAVIWLEDTAIVKKQLDNAALYYAADAETGQPLADADVKFFGYYVEQKWIREANGRTRQDTPVWQFQEFQTKTNKDGIVIIDGQKFDNKFNYSWLISVSGKADSQFTFLGFNHIWFGRQFNEPYFQTKTFIITDRPVYRPKDKVQFKAWLGTARYDADNVKHNELVPETVRYEIYNPRGEKFAEKDGVKLDGYGGFTAELELPKDATLGNYNIQVFNANRNFNGSQNFRVEEYRKPEYEVSVDAPKEPVKLGDKITATIKANYYFGSPVAEAKVKYKVMRTKADTAWYPYCRWDWFYGNGYGWLAYDAVYLPGWSKWGCCRPLPPWFPIQQGPPELVAEVETDIKPDGTVDVNIDTAVAQALFPNDSQRYSITAEVVDKSRTTITGTGTILVSEEPFKIYVWTNKGHYAAGDKIVADFQSRRLDGKPVSGDAEVVVNKISYEQDSANPAFTEKFKTTVKLDGEGKAYLSLNAAEAGQYKISCTLDGQEGGYVYNVYQNGETSSAANWKFNALELLPDKTEYAPDETVKLRINTDRENSNVLLFIKNKQNTYQLLKVDGKSSSVNVPIELGDMPNFFVEALTVSGGEVINEVKEIVVPPQQRVLNVDVKPSAKDYKPGERAKAELVITDLDGKAVVGQVAVSVYDKSVEYISGGSNIGDIKEFFWKWKRHYAPSNETNLGRYWYGLGDIGKPGMQPLGVFGRIAVPSGGMSGGFGGGALSLRSSKGMFKADARAMMDVAEAAEAPLPPAALPMANAKRAMGGGMAMDAAKKSEQEKADTDNAGQAPPLVVRKNFADTALWVGALETDKDGKANIELTMPESLTTWKINVWSMAAGTRVGQGSTEIITRKNLIIRMQTPRFLVEKDKCVFSANVHNYLPKEKEVKVDGEFTSGEQRFPLQTKTVKIASSGETRIDWEVEAKTAGEATIVMKAITDEESDAMQKTLPVYVHGILKQEARSGYIAPDKQSQVVEMNVPAERKPEQTKLTVRFSPTLAASMLDALPYLVDYPYGCTEQTLNKFLPTVLAQKVLIDSGIEIEQLKDRLTNLNAQELAGGDGLPRLPAIARKVEPVFDTNEVNKMVADGVERLKNMQCSDGGWGWFSGWGEHSSPHLTALVVHGLNQLRITNYKLRNTDQTELNAMVQRGRTWLSNYQAEQVELLKIGQLPESERKNRRYKTQADETDTFVYMVLSEYGDAKQSTTSRDMKMFLWRDKGKVSLYAAAMFGIALTNENPPQAADTNADELVKIIEQYLVQDGENQTAYLNLRNYNNWCWWYWYGSEFETQAYYLKLLMRTNPKSEVAPKLVKYLLNNRRNAAYWNSTRDTAIVVEAFAEYLKATGETKPDCTVEVLVDGEVKKSVKITPENLFEIDNTFIIEGEALTAGKHKIELRKTHPPAAGANPLYYNVYLQNFTLEDNVKKTGLEVKIERKIYKLERDKDAVSQQAGSRGQVLDLKVEKYKRIELAPQQVAALTSGDFIEVELLIESKNDYEYLLIEDLKAAGTEPVEVRSGYNGNTLGAYVEFRDEKVSFFAERLRRGQYSVSYRLRAETPGSFSALPAKIEAMYAPELKGNSDENKVQIVDKK